MHRSASAYLVALGVFIADQLSKWLVTGPIGLIREGQQIVLLPIFDLTRVHNRGISLGLFTADSELMRWLLVAITAAIAAGVAYWIAREEARADRFALSLVLGGALGNIVDRTRFGYVVDFADLHFGSFRPFLVFNVADAAISIGVLILLVRAFLVSRKAKPESLDHA